MPPKLYSKFTITSNDESQTLERLVDICFETLKALYDQKEPI